MKKKITLLLAVAMLAMMCLSASATSYYEYDNEMSTLKMELTSALYLTYSSDNEYVNVKGITRVDTGSSPVYTSFTMKSQVSYSYFISGFDDSELVSGNVVSQTVNNASSNSGYYIPQHGYNNAASRALFGWGYHDGWATSNGSTILDAPTTRGSSASQYSLNEIAEINAMMS